MISFKTKSPRSSMLPARLRWLLPATTLTWMLALSGCSMMPARGPLWSPPAAAMQRAQPLPLLPAPDANTPDSADSSVGIKELISNDAAIVKLYRELATRHNELVDSVLEKLKDQAK